MLSSEVRPMKTFDEKTTLVGVSELRTHLDQILEQAKKNKVIIEKRNKNMAVILGIKRYQEIEKMLEVFEDFVLGYLAHERKENSKLSDYIDIEELKKMI